MARGLVICGCLCGCSFTHGTAPAASDGPVTDVGTGGQKVYLDAAKVADATPDAPPSITGSIVVTPAALSPTDLKLSVEGSADWAHWGYTGASGFDHKSGGTKITTATIAGSGSILAITGAAVTSTWTGGSPDSNVTATSSGIAISNPDGVQFAVAATTTSQTLRLYIAGHSARGKLVLSLSDNSATSYTDNQFQGSNDWYARYTVVFNSAAAAQTLNVHWYDDADFTGSAWVTLLSATLQ